MVLKNINVIKNLSMAYFKANFWHSYGLKQDRAWVISMLKAATNPNNISKIEN